MLSSKGMHSTLSLSYSLSGKLHTINENPFEELCEADDDIMSADAVDSLSSDSDSDSISSSPLPSPRNILSSSLQITPCPTSLLLHAHPQEHAKSPPSSWRFTRTSPSQKYALSVLRHAYVLSQRSAAEARAMEETGGNVIWSSGTRWY